MSEQYPSTMQPKSSTSSSPGSIRRSDGRAWGLAPLGPAATMGSKLMAAAPSRRISNSRSRPNSSSVGRSRQTAGDVGEGGVGDPAGGPDAGHLPGVLHPAEPLDHVLGGNQLGGREPLRGEPPLLRPGDAVGLEADPAVALGGGGVVDDPLLLRPGDLDLRLNAGGGQLVGRLVLVPAVSDEEHLVGPDEEEARGAGEARQVPDVDESGDEEGVDAGLGEEPSEAVDPPGDLEGGQGGQRDSFPGASSNWARTASTARR